MFLKPLDTKFDRLSYFKNLDITFDLCPKKTIAFDF
jgi:hypothetical protein